MAVFPNNLVGCFWNPVNNGINDQPQLVFSPDFWLPTVGITPTSVEFRRQDAAAWAASLQQAQLASNTADFDDIRRRLRASGRFNRTECEALNPLQPPFKAIPGGWWFTGGFFFGFGWYFGGDIWLDDDGRCGDWGGWWWCIVWSGEVIFDVFESMQKFQLQSWPSMAHGSKRYQKRRPNFEAPGGFWAWVVVSNYMFYMSPLKKGEDEPILTIIFFSRWVGRKPPTSWGLPVFPNVFQKLPSYI